MMTNQKPILYATLGAVLALLFAPMSAWAQIGLSISLGGPEYAAPPPPPPAPEYVVPGYAAPVVTYGPEYVPDYYDYHHRPHPRPRPHPVAHGGAHGHR